MGFRGPQWIRKIFPNRCLVVGVQNLAVQRRRVLILERKIATWKSCSHNGWATQNHPKYNDWYYCRWCMICMMIKSSKILWFIFDNFDMIWLWSFWHVSLKRLCLWGQSISTTPWASQHTKANKITPQLQTSHLEGTWWLRPVHHSWIARVFSRWGHDITLTGHHLWGCVARWATGRF